MKADITRKTFHAVKHFSRVLMQQGRVQLDADWNEQVAIHHHYLRHLATDLIGPCGGPKDNLGFEVHALGSATPSQIADFAFRWGHYYVDGLLCEVESTPVAVTGFPANTTNRLSVGLWTVDGQAFDKGQYILLYDADPTALQKDSGPLRITDIDYTHKTITVSADISAFASKSPTRPSIRRITTYLTQPDFTPPPLTKGSYHVYLDVWERLISYVEDDSIREVALDGPDTAARGKIVWQVKLLNADVNDHCLTPQGLNDHFQPANLARLKARARPAQTSDDPCTIAPDALYRGPENQCYRVEVHKSSIDDQGKQQSPTFKWSRENGDVVFPIRSGGGTNALVLENLGRDDRFGLNVGDWVEVQDDDYVLSGRATALLQVQSINRSRLTVVLSGAPDASVGKDPAKHPLLRRWDHKQGEASEAGTELASDKAVVIPSGDPSPGTWLTLEDGVQVQFSNPKNTVYRTGDYWLIPARVATGNVEWPSETVAVGQGKTVTEPLALLPTGIVHHYAPLALLTVDGSNVITTSSCLSAFAALAKQMTEAVAPSQNTASTGVAMTSMATSNMTTTNMAMSNTAETIVAQTQREPLTIIGAQADTAAATTPGTPTAGKP